MCWLTNSPVLLELRCLTVCSSRQMVACGFVSSSEKVPNPPLPKIGNTPDSGSQK